ncbi:unnamed protein product [Cylindrotheca closterium]|uniref:SAP domain-containing protein n=1 Tax=Cylindrotheca closterium TaxID=2856 RepID=A0AAD2JLM5_9STRA|nr:unnamed protein product [Cylindrotheca closterium]
MLSDFISKASRGTNESSKKEDDSVAASNSSTLGMVQAADGATGTYPSPDSSPYFLKDGDDAPVFVARCPSTTPFPHVRLVDGSLTYDNVQTPPDTVHDGAETKVEETADEKIQQTVHFDKEDEGNNEDEPADTKASTGTITSEPTTNEHDLILEANDPMSLSLNASDLDMSAINDLTLTTPSKTSETIEDSFENTGDAATDVDLINFEMKEKEILQEAASPKSEQSAIQVENKKTLLSKVTKKMKRMHELPSRPALLLSVLLGASLLFFASRRYAHADVAPKPVQMSKNLIESATQPETLKNTTAPDIGITKEDESATGNNSTSTQANAVAKVEVLPVLLNASDPVEEFAVEKEGNQKGPSARISVSSNAQNIIKSQAAYGSDEFPSLDVNDTFSCGSSQWNMGVAIPQIAMLAMLLFASTSMFGSKRPKIVHPKKESVKREHHISPLASKALESYDLSKYFDDHTHDQLREMLRVRKCKTIGKKHILVQRLASVYKAELETLTVVQLRKILKSKNFTQYGSKTEIIRVIVEECP